MKLTIIGIFTILVIFCLVYPAMVQPRVPASRATCASNLKQIGLALHTYLDVYGTLPPAFVADEQGRPMHSWRVLLLPFLERQELYNQYNFAEPWDGPNNSKLHGTRLKIFQCPSSQPGPHTNYLAVTGERCGFRGSEPPQFSKITDGLDETLAIVETTGTSVHWMSPVDFAVQRHPASGDVAGSGSEHKGGLNVLFFDGHVHFLSGTLPQTLLNALYTRDGGESVPDNF